MPATGSAVASAIAPLPDDRPIGTVSLPGLDEPGQTAQLGYWLITGARGRGLASAATTLVTEWAFTRSHLTAIQIDREPSNQTSARAAERLGAVITRPRWVQ